MCPPRSRRTIDVPASFDSILVKPISVILAEDHAGFRKSLKALLETHQDIQVVGEAKDGHQAVALCVKLSPDVVIMDIAMPILNGLLATRRIMEVSSNTHVLMLSSHPDPEYIKQSMLCGASGYLIKQSFAPVFADAIREVAQGKTFFSASIPKPLQAECRKAFSKRRPTKL
jgi:DNA-binding NarL/FixJ family response regulator